MTEQYQSSLGPNQLAWCRTNLYGFNKQNEQANMAKNDTMMYHNKYPVSYETKITPH